MPMQSLEVENTIFHIGKDDNGYWGINHKYVEGSETKVVVNGLEGNFSHTYVQTIRLCWLSVKKNTIANLYNETDLRTWAEAFDRLENEFEKIGITDAWQKTKFIHLN